jgi:hypothetical protein
MSRLPKIALDLRAQLYFWIAAKQVELNKLTP